MDLLGIMYVPNAAMRIRIAKIVTSICNMNAQTLVCEGVPKTPKAIYVMWSTLNILQRLIVI